MSWWIISLTIWSCVGTIFGAGIIAEEDMPKRYKRFLANLIIGPAWVIALILVLLSAIPRQKLVSSAFDRLNNWLAKE